MLDEDGWIVGSTSSLVNSTSLSSDKSYIMDSIAAKLKAELDLNPLSDPKSKVISTSPSNNNYNLQIDPSSSIPIPTCTPIPSNISKSISPVASSSTITTTGSRWGGGLVKRRVDNWFALVDQVDSSWRDTIQPLLQHYQERTPGSFVEEKEVNLTWHYRNADLEFGSWQAAELQVNLEKILSHMAVSVK